MNQACITLTRALILMGFAVGHAGSATAVQYTGVNLAGAEFGEGSLPGTYNSNYTYPTQTEVDYFKGKGMNIARLCFRWERLQQTTNAALNSSELNRLNTFVSATTAKGVSVILDPHNYARYYGTIIGSNSVPISAFSNFWWRVADIYRTNNRVIFGLMNEPNTMATEAWRDAANAAIVAIRATGATNLILVPGNAWTGAHSWSQNWYGTPNATVMLTITDSGNNFAFDVHQYLDSDSSGTSDTIVDATIGATRLAGFTQWLKNNNRRGFLGEFAVANSTIGAGIGDEAISNMLAHVQSNSDVWLGWTWWAAGPWWGEYMFTLEPTGGSTDRPAMSTLTNFFATTVTAPAAPIVNAATGVTNNAFIANWSSASGATGYRLDVANNNVFTSYVTGHSNLDVVSVTSRVVTNLSANTTYYYRLRAYNTGGASTNSATNSVTTLPNPPPPPVATAATGVSNTSFAANWNSASTPNGYRLDVATNNAFASFVSNYQDLDAGNGLARHVTNLMASTTYFFRVRAYNAGGISANSGTITVTTSPNPPVIAPILGCELSGGNLLLYWPTSHLGFTLESATHLSAPSWVSNSSAPAILGGNYFVTNPVSGAAMFFRLTK